MTGYKRNANSVNAIFNEVDADPRIIKSDINSNKWSFIWLSNSEIYTFKNWLNEYKSEYPTEQRWFKRCVFQYDNSFSYEFNRTKETLEIKNIPLTIENIYNLLRKRNSDETEALNSPDGFNTTEDGCKDLYFSEVGSILPKRAFRYDLKWKMISMGIDKELFSGAYWNYIRSLNIADYHKSLIKSITKSDNEGENNPFSEGYNAYMKNNPTCPYKQGTPEFDDWIDGWQEAEMDMEP